MIFVFPRGSRNWNSTVGITWVIFSFCTKNFNLSWFTVPLNSLIITIIYFYFCFRSPRQESDGGSLFLSSPIFSTDAASNQILIPSSWSSLSTVLPHVITIPSIFPFALYLASLFHRCNPPSLLLYIPKSEALPPTSTETLFERVRGSCFASTATMVITSKMAIVRVAVIIIWVNQP